MIDYGLRPKFGAAHRKVVLGFIESALNHMHIRRSEDRESCVWASMYSELLIAAICLSNWFVVVERECNPQSGRWYLRYGY